MVPLVGGEGRPPLSKTPCIRSCWVNDAWGGSRFLFCAAGCARGAEATPQSAGGRMDRRPGPDLGRGSGRGGGGAGAPERPRHCVSPSTTSTARQHIKRGPEGVRSVPRLRLGRLRGRYERGIPPRGWSPDPHRLRGAWLQRCARVCARGACLSARGESSPRSRRSAPVRTGRDRGAPPRPRRGTDRAGAKPPRPPGRPGPWGARRSHAPQRHSRLRHHR